MLVFVNRYSLKKNLVLLWDTSDRSLLLSIVPAPVKEDSRLLVLGITLLGELLSQIMNPDRNVVNKMGFF